MKLPDLSESIASFVDGVAHLEDESTSMTATDIILSMPCEIQFDSESDDSKKIQLSPPLQRTETSILPVLHQIKVHFSIDEESLLNEENVLNEISV